MNVATFSPALALLFVFALLWILMGVRLEELSAKQKTVFVSALILLAAGNHILREILGSASYSKLLALTMHLPVFLLFLCITKCGILKMAFMILSAVVFISPTIIINNQIKRLFSDALSALLLTNLISYAAILLLAWVVFRNGFNHLIRYGDNRTIISFSLVPLLYYVYMFAVMNTDLSPLTGFSGYIVRFLPTIYVFSFYFLLLHNYKTLDEKRRLESTQAAMSQELDAAEKQISLLNETRTKTAVYQHDMRHHLLALDGFLNTGNLEQAREYIQSVQADVESISIKRFCENELINLLCSSFASKASQVGITLTVHAKVPGEFSFPDTELCSLVSNALENALNATAQLPDTRRWVEFYCEYARNKLLIEVKNPYDGQIHMVDGLPSTKREGHGYGCHVIQSIAELHHGLCSFSTANNLFVLRVVLPLT